MEKRIVMVTGSGMGIGLACAEAFAREGATVIMADIQKPEEQARKLIDAGYDAVAYQCDVSDVQAVKEMIDWIVSTYGRLDAALNNAGIQTPQRPMAEITDDEFDRTVAVDLKGVWNCMKFEIGQMLKQGGGAIVNTPMAEELIRRNPQLEKELVRDIPAGRLGKPEEIADAVLWLCSPASSFVHGHALLVDGGFTIH